MKEFDWNKFKGNGRMCVHCQTEEEANKFCKMMDEHGMKWCGGGSYLDNTCWDAYREDIVYFGKGTTYGNIKYAKSCGCDIFEFSDYFVEGQKTSDELMKIVVFKDGNTITAKVYMNNVCVKEALVNPEEVAIKKVIQKLWL